MAYGDKADFPYLELYDGTATGTTGSANWGVENAQLDAYACRSHANAWALMGVLTENAPGTETPSLAFIDQEKALGQYGLGHATPIRYNSQIEPLS